MITIKTVTMKNFLSVGAVSQTVEINKKGLSLVLGENIDMGGNGSRNGVGKSTLLSAISYGLYGQVLADIKVNHLINNINQKNMEVSIEFEKDDHTYTIERGRKPTFFRYLIDNESVGEDSTDDAQGENKETQKEIDEVLGLSHELSKHIITLNTYTEPFLTLESAKQRKIIEELLCVTQLSQKADVLKDLIKSTKIGIDGEEFRIKTIKQTNEKVKASIDELQRKIVVWNKKHDDTTIALSTAIQNLQELDIDTELQAHRDLDFYNQVVTTKNQLSRDLALKERHLNQVNNQLNSTLINYEKILKNECPTCGQDVHDHNHEKIQADLEAKILELNTMVEADSPEITELRGSIKEINETLKIVSKPAVFYDTFEQALNHRNTLDSMIKELEKELEQHNPYSTISLDNNLQEVDYNNLNKLVKDREHQEFLLKLLTNKDSFIRKRIVDQNIAFLNTRLSEYLTRLGLPHEVKFINDLSVEINKLGQDMSYYNLSRGERTRLNLGLSLSFRDIFESANMPINILCVDELLDQGLDTTGIESAVEIFKEISRDRNKNILLISHREELQSRVSNTLWVIKENEFTSFDWNYTPTT